MRLLRAALVLVLAGLLVPLVLQPRSASAHAVLERSTPSSDQRLQEPPELVATWFSEQLERSLTTIEVLDTGGNDVHVGETQFANDDEFYAAVGLPPDLPPGFYTVTYENVSKVDGHPWSGFFTFIVLNADGSVPEGQALTPEGFAEGGGGQGFLPGVGDTTLRWFGLLAATVLAGSFIFYLLVARPATQFLPEDGQEELDEAAMTTAVDLSVLALPLLAISVVGQLLLLADRLGGPDTISDVLFDTRTGSLWLSRAGLSLALLLILLPIAFGLVRVGRLRTLLASVALLFAVGIIMTYSLGSHASGSGGEFWSVGSDFLHFVAVGAWVGGLLQLALVFYWTRDRLRDSERLLYQANTLDRFSWLAAISVTIILGTGLFNTFVEIPFREALWDTTYGRTLLVKLALVLPMLAVAGINAVFLKPAIVRGIDEVYGGGEPPGPDEGGPLPEGEPTPIRGGAQVSGEPGLERLKWLLPRTTALEFILAAAVLVATAVLSQTTPAEGEIRQAVSEPAGDYLSEQIVADLNIELQITPFIVGLNTFYVKLEPAGGGELGVVQRVQLRYVLDDPNAATTAGGSTTELTAVPGSPNVYSAESASFSQPGQWRVDVEVRRSQVDDVKTAFGMVVGGDAATLEQPEGMFALPFTFVDWNIVAGGALLALGLGLVLIWRSRPPTWRGSTSTSVGAAGGVLLMCGAVLLFGVHPHQPVGFNEKSPIEADEESVGIGRQLYEMNCAVCHGDTGRGNGPRAAELDVQPADFSVHVPLHGDGLLFTYISEGMPLQGENKNMPSWKNELTVDERWHLVNYLRVTFGEKDPRQFTPIDPEDGDSTPASDTTPGPAPTGTPAQASR